jgi:hypothetical protein
MGTRDNKITTNTETKSRQKRTRNKRHIKEEDKRIEDENGHRGRKKKVPELIITKPVIESTNQFFIAVCAPETYKPKVVVSNRRVAGARIVDDVEKNNRTNVFLRQRTRNSINNNINRFIHNPILQQSRDSDVSATATESQHTVIELSNEILFPSLGKPTTTTTTTTTKLNFKEMVMKNSTVAAATAATASESPVVISKDSSSKSLSSFTSSCRPLPSSHKSISSGNIFLAAFQNNHNDDDEYDDYCDTVSEKPFVSSSSLIDSCDRKYDRLYS